MPCKYLQNFIFIFLISLFLTGSSFSKDRKLLQKRDNSSTAPIGTGVTLFSESFESGSLLPWFSKDETFVPAQWHLTDWMAYGDSGMCWHMADTTLGTNGGYDNSWYQVLDTDPIALSGSNLQLTFYQRYSVESQGGEPTGYDGWDGINVRISTDGGTTWDVLTNPNPAYTATSLYSFGLEHGEGTGIPGWTGNLNAWTLTTFDLSAYDGQNINVRFAFASDGGYSTPDQASLFGWEVDDIMVTNSLDTLFSNDGALSQMTASNNAATGADLWHTVQNGASEGSYFASCNNSSDTYVPNMINSLTSDWFYLNRYSTNIYMDFDLQGTWDDNDEFPNIDFFGAYVQVQGETQLRYVSNITADPNGTNYVYSDAYPTWLAFSATYSDGLIDLTPLKGKVIRIVFVFYSDEDTPIGSAVQIDNVQVWTDEIVPVELTSFTVNISKSGYVILNWSTATEINNHMFEIQRRNENTRFTPIGFIEGNGTTTEPREYSYTDKSVKTGIYYYRLKQLDFGGNYEYSDEVMIDAKGPLTFKLGQNYPNPFNPSTTIQFSIPESGYVRLSVYNMIGEEVKVLVDEKKDAGFYEKTFDASNLPSGAYVYKLESPGLVQAKKMLLMK